MFKRLIITTVLVGGFLFAGAADANAWGVRRIAPVRRVAARAVLPPYPVTRRVVAGPIVHRPVVYARPVIYGRPVIYAAPTVYFGY